MRMRMMSFDWFDRYLLVVCFILGWNGEGQLWGEGRVYKVVRSWRIYTQAFWFGFLLSFRVL